MDAEYPRLVHLTTALVGTPDSRLVLRRLRRDYCFADRSGPLHEMFFGENPAGSGRSRYMVQFRPVAVLNARLARSDGRLESVLSHDPACHRPRHHFLLGRANDDVRPEVHE